MEIARITINDRDFPALLREIPHAPLTLYFRGALPALEQTAFAIVGTRHASPEGKHIARRFGGALSEHFAIVSGLAFGIDAAAHEGTIEAKGVAIAVLAGGLDSIYPHSNQRLAERILAQGGTLISEYPPGTPPYAAHFLERNRIVSGLSRGVLVIEAPHKSGALVTARFALEQNRDVFAIPGAITNSNFAGSNNLIRQGAECVTTPEDIFDAYGLPHEAARPSTATNASDSEILILKALYAARAPLGVDKIIEITKLESRIASTAIGFLLGKNVIEESAAGYTIKPS